jgi:pilus assembly protein CpaF
MTGRFIAGQEFQITERDGPGGLEGRCRPRFTRPAGRLHPRLPPTDGSRVAAVIPSCSVNGVTLTIHKFNARHFSIDDLVRIGTLPQRLASELENRVVQQRNILVSGGTGTGKNTQLNILAAFIPKDHRVVIIEDTSEIQIHKSGLVRFEARRE